MALVVHVGIGADWTMYVPCMVKIVQISDVGDTADFAATPRPHGETKSQGE